MTAPTVRSWSPPAADLPLLAVGALAAVLLGAASMVTGPVLAVGVAAIAVFVVVAARPVAAAYIYLGTLPFVTGMVRGALIPLLRPNEAIQVYLTAAVLTGLYVRFCRGETPHLTFTRLDRAMLVLTTLASVWPLAWQLARAQVPTSADAMSTLPLWRFFALYVMYRFVVRDHRQLRRCLVILLAGASALAVIAALQSLNLLRLGTLWAPDNPTDSAGRGNATLSSAIAVGDYLACSLAVVLAWALRTSARRPLLYVTGGILLLGALGSGQFSAWIGAGIVVVLVAGHEHQLRRLVTRAAPLALVGLVVTWPVVGKRLAGFGGGGAGVPSSWVGRIDNLTNFYLPALGGFRWILGVRPDSVLQAPETWREVIYLESGFLWFLWVGGIPLLLGAIWFFRVAMRHTRDVAAARTDDVGVVALATWASLWVFAVLTLIDMHLTLRGAGDLLFILLGLSSSRALAPAAPPTQQAHAPPPPETVTTGRP